MSEAAIPSPERIRTLALDCATRIIEKMHGSCDDLNDDERLAYTLAISFCTLELYRFLGMDPPAALRDDDLAPSAPSAVNPPPGAEGRDE